MGLEPPFRPESLVARWTCAAACLGSCAPKSSMTILGVMVDQGRFQNCLHGVGKGSHGSLVPAPKLADLSPCAPGQKASSVVRHGGCCISAWPRVLEVLYQALAALYGSGESSVTRHVSRREDTRMGRGPHLRGSDQILRHGIPGPWGRVAQHLIRIVAAQLWPCLRVRLSCCCKQAPERAPDGFHGVASHRYFRVSGTMPN